MSWIKTKDFKPPTHEVILFQDRWRNEHYGVLCGEFSSEEKRNKYWCHLYQRTYDQRNVIYWCEIPINRHLIRERDHFSFEVNKFLSDTITNVEKNILADFKRHQQENPSWKADSFVQIAVRDTIWRIMEALKVLKDDKG